MPHHRSPLYDLPVELLVRILFLSQNVNFVTTAWYTYKALGHLSPRDHYMYLMSLAQGDELHALQLGLQYRFLSLPLLDLFQQHNINDHWQKTQLLKTWQMPVWLFNTSVAEQTQPASKKRKVNSSSASNKDRASEQEMTDRSRLNIVERLLVWGIPPDSGNCLPLIKSSQLGMTDMVRLLLAFNASPKSNDNMALCLAAARGHYSIVKQLVRAGAPLESRVLRYALQKQEWRIVKYLMKKGAVPDFETVRMINSSGIQMPTC